MRKIFFSFLQCGRNLLLSFSLWQKCAKLFLHNTKFVISRKCFEIPRKENGSSSKSLKFHKNKICLINFFMAINYSNMLGAFHTVNLQAQSCKNVTRYSTITAVFGLFQFKKRFFSFLPEKWMRSSRVVGASCCQCQSCNSPVFDPSAQRNLRGGR